jgi:hypothetical protein
MPATLWMNVISGEQLDRSSLDAFRHKARRAYEANTHIFEDEHEALAALGVVPIAELEPAVGAEAPPLHVRFVA